MVAQWEEHDTWPSRNRSLDWHWECATCSEQYDFYRELSTWYVIRKADADKLRSLRDRADEKALWESIDKFEIPFR